MVTHEDQGWYSLTFLFLEFSYSKNVSKNLVVFLEGFLEIRIFKIFVF